MTTTTHHLANRAGSRYSTRELQAAAAALAAGQFTRGAGGGWVPGLVDGEFVPGPVADLTPPDQLPATTGRAGAVAPTVPATPGLGAWAAPCSGGQLVRVLAAHAGAGASTIALAIADAACGRGLPTRVLDAAAPDWSGLVGATTTELGAAHGWRRGRRGEGLIIDRVQEHVPGIDQVPAPRDCEPMAMTVVDTGWTHRELAAATGSWLATTRADVDVVVTRVGDTAFGQAELVLDATKRASTVLVVLGANRWSDARFAATGPRLQELHRNQAVVFAPLLSAKALPGLGPDPLPRPLMTSAQRLLDHLAHLTGPHDAARPC